MRKVIPKTSVISMVIILALSTWPIWTGDIMRNWYRPEQYGVQIPDYYWEANEYLEQISTLNHKTLLLPPSQIYIGTSWGYQGTSQFYNLMFNVPLITGNEIPYGVTVNKTLVDHVYAIYYKVPHVNDTLDVTKEIRNIVTWQNDKAISTPNLLQIEFNSTYYLNKWHQVELELPSAETWSNYTHMKIQLTGQLRLNTLHIGIGNSNGYGGWWYAYEHVYESDGGTFIPTETGTQFIHSRGNVTLVINLEKPNRSVYSIDDVTSVWIQYFVIDSSDIASLQINEMLAARLSHNTLYQADLWAENDIKYLLVDLSIKDGTKSDPEFWLRMLDSSEYFKLIWQEGALYLFENMRA